MTAATEPSSTLHRALEGVESRLEGKSVVCLPDLFLDHIVSLPKWGEVQKPITAAVLRGGGNLRGGEQRLTAGGNAFNTARALARLGVAARFIARTSREALAFAERETSGEPLDLTLVGTGGRTSMTAALELGPERVNVMINDPGSLDGLQFQDLGPGADAALRGATAVLVSNWAQNRTQGTPFAAAVLQVAKQAGALTFLDPSDVSQREQALLEFIHAVAQGDHLDWLMVNEGEARELSRVLLLHDSSSSPCAHEDSEAHGREFSKRAKGGLAVHTLRGSWSFRKGKAEAHAPVSIVPPKRTTGAGDVWNAGFIAGTLGGLSPADRLALANATAGLFVLQPSGPPPSLSEVRTALQTPAARSP